MAMTRGIGVALVAVTAAACLLLGGCGGDSAPDPTPTASVQIMLVDAPANQISELHVRLNGVQVARRSNETMTLLEARDLPADTDVIAAGNTPVLLGTVDVPEGTYTFARLAIDGASPVNRVRLTDGTEHPIVEVVHQQQLGAQLNGSFQVVAGTNMTLLFDFAAAASVRETANGWVLSPQIFSQYIERGVQFGGLRGVVRERDGAPLIKPADQVLGVFLRDQGTQEVVSLAEVCCLTGEYAMPQLVPGHYRLSVQYATRDWAPVGAPLLDEVVVRITAGSTSTASVEIDQ